MHRRSLLPSISGRLFINLVAPCHARQGLQTHRCTFSTMAVPRGCRAWMRLHDALLCHAMPCRALPCPAEPMPDARASSQPDDAPPARVTLLLRAHRRPANQTRQGPSSPPTPNRRSASPASPANPFHLPTPLSLARSADLADIIQCSGRFQPALASWRDRLTKLSRTGLNFHSNHHKRSPVEGKPPFGQTGLVSMPFNQTIVESPL